MKQLQTKIENLFSSSAAQLYDHRIKTVCFIFILSLVLSFGMSSLTIDTRDESFFHDDDPILVTYNKFRDNFGQDDVFIVALKPEQGLTLDFLKILKAIHRDLEAKVPYVDEITSLMNARIVRAQGDTIHVGEFLEDMPDTQVAVDQLLAQISHYPLYEKILVSKDRSLVSIIIRSQATVDDNDSSDLSGFDDEQTDDDNATNYLSNAENITMYNAIVDVISSYENDGTQFYFAGVPAFVAQITKGIEKDIGLMMPLSLLATILFLFLLFRRVSGVIFPVLIVFLSLISSFGLMGTLNIPITTVIQILPTFLIVVGIGDSVHILTIFYRQLNQTGDKRKSVIYAVGYAGLPVLMTSVTTACGLISFTLADVKSIAQLGIIAPVGVMLAFFYTIALLPALISFFPIKRKKQGSVASLTLDKVFDGISQFTTRSPVRIILVFSVILAAAIYSSITLKFSHNALTWFPEDTMVRQSSELLDHTNGGTVMLEVLLDTGVENGVQDPGFLKKLDKVSQSIISDLSVHEIKAAKAVSISDIVKEINRALHEDRSEAYIIPDQPDLIAQELFLFESSGSDDLEEVAESTYQTTRLSLLAPFTDSILYLDYVNKLETYLKEQLPNVRITITGHISLFIKITKNFITSMAKSYGFALVVITALMIFMIGRTGIGLLSMVANLFPIIIVFGVMGAINIPIDMSTVLIGSIILGLVVDDTIHFLHHFRRSFDDTQDVQVSIKETLSNTGRALLITSVVLCCGFLIYTTSYLLVNIRFGILMTCAVVFAIVADFLLIPAMLTLIYDRKQIA